MIKVYTGLKGFGMFFVFIAGMILFLYFFSWGITKAAELFLPLLIIMSYLLIIVFVFGIVPATLLKHLRPSLGVTAVRMSQALGVTTGIASFFFIIKTFGFWGVFFAFLFQFLAPIAIVGAALKGSWYMAGHLLLWISFTYWMKFYSQRLSNLNFHDQEKSRIIDIDAIEVRDH